LACAECRMLVAIVVTEKWGGEKQVRGLPATFSVKGKSFA
jgi:hypothetical protein